MLLNERETRKERRIGLRENESLVDSQRGIICFLISFSIKIDNDDIVGR